jgi:hypothetical protein
LGTIKKIYPFFPGFSISKRSHTLLETAAIVWRFWKDLPAASEDCLDLLSGGGVKGLVQE